MRLLILQIVIKQWDKSQRTEAHERLKATIPDQHPIISPPAFYVFDKHFVIDQHGDDIQDGPVKHSKLADQTIKFDRFQVDLDDKVMAYVGAKSNETRQIMDSLNNQWIQCKYNCRCSDVSTLTRTQS